MFQTSDALRSPLSTSAWIVSELDVPKRSTNPHGVRFDVVEELQHRHGADARRGERAFAVRAHVAVDHASVVVRRDGYAAVDVRDDEVAVLVFATEFGGVELGDGLLVQDVRVRDAVDALDAGEASELAVFVDVRGVEGERGTRVRLREAPREHDAEAGRMLRTADSGDGVVEELLVDAHEPAVLRACAAAAPDERVDGLGCDALVLQHRQDDVAAEGHLVVHVRKLQQHGRVVEEVFFEDGILVLEQAHLR